MAARPLKSGAALFFAALVVFCLVSPPARAQLSPGNSCSNTGSVSLSNVNPAYLLACNGSTWGLGLTITSVGLVGIGTATPNAGSILDLSGSTTSMLLPSGTSAQRPTAANGMIRYNSTVPQVEAYYSGAWQALGAAGITLPLGTSASATNPQRSGDATTGLFSPAVNTVAIAEGGSQQLTVNVTGVGIGSTSPTVSLDISQKTDAVSLPSGTSAQRPTPANGMLRYNSTVPQVEAYYNSQWNALAGTAPGTPCTSSTFYNASTNGSTQLVALSSGKIIYICGYTIIAAGTVNVQFTGGTGSNCGSSTANLTPAYQLTAGTVIVDSSTVTRGLQTASSAALCISTNAAVAVQAMIYYVQQ